MMKLENNYLRIRLVVTDLDGTFLNDGKIITAENLNAVRNLADNNILFSFCTGRPVSMIGAFVKQADIRIPVIGCNGGLVYDPVKKTVLLSRTFPAGISAALTEYSLSCGFDYLAYTTDTIYYSANSRRIRVFRDYNRYAERENCAPAVLKCITREDSIPREKICKVLITELHGNDLGKMSGFLSGMSGIVCTPSMSGVLDVMPEGVSKGAGIAYLASFLGIDMKDVCVFGDNTNDVSMMQRAGMSVCMANGTEDARTAAAFVTERTNNDSGFAELISGYLRKPETR